MEAGIDAEPHERDERIDAERDRDAWNVPRSPHVLAMPPFENWPEREPAFEEGLAGMGGGQAPAA
jgi:hypothetical protein